jgi:hypothetical protein
MLNVPSSAQGTAQLAQHKQVLGRQLLSCLASTGAWRRE